MGTQFHALYGTPRGLGEESILAEIRKTIGPMVKTEVQTFLDRHLKITIVPPTP